MTYAELITRTYGENPQTKELLQTLLVNSVELIGNLIGLLTDEEIATLREAIATESGPEKLNSLVNHFFTQFDILTIPNDGQTPVMAKAGGTLAALLKANLPLFKDEEKEE